MKRLCVFLFPLLGYAAAPVADWSPNLTLLSAWQSNVTNGEAVWDRIGVLQFGADSVASSQYAVSSTDVAHLTVHLGADWYPRFDALDQGAAGGSVDWQHTFGRGVLAPVFVLEASGDGVVTGESGRRGITGAVTLRLRKQWGESWHTALIQKIDEYSAKNKVFDGQSSRTAVEIGRDLNEVTRLVWSAAWREGDVVTYAQYHRPDLLSIAKAAYVGTTFHQLMTGYRAYAHTASSSITLIHATSDEAAVELGYEYARTDRTGLRFVNQIISLSIVRQF